MTYGRLFLTDILPDEDVNQSLRDIINLGTPFPNNTRDDSAHGHHQMVNTKIRLILFFAAEDGDALYSQQEQDLELTVVQNMSSLLQNLDFN